MLKTIKKCPKCGSEDLMSRPSVLMGIVPTQSVLDVYCNECKQRVATVQEMFPSDEFVIKRFINKCILLKPCVIETYDCDGWGCRP